MTQNQEGLIAYICREIDAQARSCAAEQYSPHREADEMDSFIKLRKENVQELREIRTKLEDIFTGLL